MNENKFTPRAETALRLSQEAAGDLGHGYVGTEHLLLGLLREEDGVAHDVLTEAGLTAVLPEALWHPTGESLLLSAAADPALWEGDGHPALVLPVYTRLSDAEENELKRLGMAEPATVATTGI